jgi:hypothetical protein
MKTITAIYLNCKPELRDEWLTAIDVDSEVDESNVCFEAFLDLSVVYILILLSFAVRLQKMPFGCSSDFITVNTIPSRHQDLTIIDAQIHLRPEGPQNKLRDRQAALQAGHFIVRTRTSFRPIARYQGKRRKKGTITWRLSWAHGFTSTRI